MARYGQQEDYWNAMAGCFQQAGNMGGYTIGNSTSAAQFQAVPPVAPAPARPKPGDIIHDPKMLEVGMVVETLDSGIKYVLGPRRSGFGWNRVLTAWTEATRPRAPFMWDESIEFFGLRVVSVPWEAEKSARVTMDCEACPTPHSFCGVEGPHGLCNFCNRCPTWIAKHAPPVGSKWVSDGGIPWVVTGMYTHLVERDGGGLAIEEFYRLYKRADERPSVGSKWREVGDKRRLVWRVMMTGIPVPDDGTVRIELESIGCAWAYSGTLAAFYESFKRADDEPAKVIQRHIDDSEALKSKPPAPTPRRPAVGERWKWKQRHDPGRYFDVIEGADEDDQVRLDYGTSKEYEMASYIAERAEYVGPSSETGLTPMQQAQVTNTRRCRDCGGLAWGRPLPGARCEGCGRDGKPCTEHAWYPVQYEAGLGRRCELCSLDEPPTKPEDAESRIHIDVGIARPAKGVRVPTPPPAPTCAPGCTPAAPCMRRSEVLLAAGSDEKQIICDAWAHVHDDAKTRLETDSTKRLMTGSKAWARSLREPYEPMRSGLGGVACRLVGRQTR